MPSFEANKPLLAAFVLPDETQVAFMRAVRTNEEPSSVLTFVMHTERYDSFIDSQDEVFADMASDDPHKAFGLLKNFCTAAALDSTLVSDIDAQQRHHRPDGDPFDQSMSVLATIDSVIGTITVQEVLVLTYEDPNDIEQYRPRIAFVTPENS